MQSSRKVVKYGQCSRVLIVWLERTTVDMIWQKISTFEHLSKPSRLEFPGPFPPAIACVQEPNRAAAKIPGIAHLARGSLIFFHKPPDRKKS